MNHTSLRAARSRSTQRWLEQAGVLACCLVAGLLELWALQRRRLAGRHRADLSGR